MEKEKRSQVCLEKVKFPGASKRLGTAAHAELAVDVAEMLFHCASSYSGPRKLDSERGVKT